MKLLVSLNTKIKGENGKMEELSREALEATVKEINEEMPTICGLQVVVAYLD